MTEGLEITILHEAEELLGGLGFDWRYGTHARGLKMSVSVIITSKPDDETLRGLVACHTLGHAEAAWSMLDAMCECNCGEFHFLQVRQDGTAKIEFRRSQKVECTKCTISAWLRPECPAPDVVLVHHYAGFANHGAERPTPIQIHPIPLDDRIHNIVGVSEADKFNLIFETHAANLALGSVVFSFRTNYGTPTEQILESGILKFNESVEAGRWIATWDGRFAIPKDKEIVTLVYGPVKERT